MFKYLRMLVILVSGICIGIGLSYFSSYRVREYLVNFINSRAQNSSSFVSVDSKFDTQTYLKQFPAVREGFRRYIIPPPKNDKNILWLVDILVGKYEMADCNSTGLENVKVELKQDWTGSSYRYYFYEIETDGLGVSTLIGCPSELKFDVAFHKDIPHHLNYPRTTNNEYYPIVVDVNSNFEIGYRLWTNDTVIERAKLIE